MSVSVGGRRTTTTATPYARRTSEETADPTSDGADDFSKGKETIANNIFAYLPVDKPIDLQFSLSITFVRNSYFKFI